MRKQVLGALALASVAMVTPVVAHAQAAAAGKPVIAVMYFDNNSFGKDRADYDGLGKGIADMLITDMASNPNVQIVERERVQALLTEQNLTKQGAIDPQTAVRLGKIIGAQYMITGGLISDGKGALVLTAHTINVQTSAVGNPVRLNGKSDDVLGAIAQLSEKLNNEMKLPALRVGDASSSMGAQPAGQPAAMQADTTKMTHVVAEQKPADPKPQDAKPAESKAVSKPATHVAQAKPARKMDMKTALLYSKALEEEDAGNRTKAVELYRQVVEKFPDYPPAQQKIERLSRG